jgi:hypothetical protein
MSFRIVAGQPANKPTSVFQALDSWALVLSVYPLDSSNKGPDDETYSCAGVDTGRGKDSDIDNRVIYTLLPLQLDMFGSIAVHSQQHHIIHYTPSWPGSQDVTTKLQSLPVLRCNDVELFYERGLERHWRDSWTPRRYQTTWQFSRGGAPPRVRASQVQRRGHLAFLSNIFDNIGLYSNVQTLTREVVACA